MNVWIRIDVIILQHVPILLDHLHVIVILDILAMDSVVSVSITKIEFQYINFNRNTRNFLNNSILSEREFIILYRMDSELRFLNKNSLCFIVKSIIEIHNGIILVKGGCNLGFVYSFRWCSKQFNKGV